MCLNSYATSSIVIPEAVIDSARLEEVSVTLQGGITDDQFGGKKKKQQHKKTSKIFRELSFEGKSSNNVINS